MALTSCVSDLFIAFYKSVKVYCALHATVNNANTKTYSRFILRFYLLLHELLLI